MPVTVQIRRKGVITLPAELRRRYALNEGDIFTLVDVGDGSFVLVPQVSQVVALGDKVAQILEKEDVSLDEVLAALDEEREQYYRTHYASD